MHLLSNAGGAQNLDKMDIHFMFANMQVDIEWFRLKLYSENQNTFWHAHSNTEIHYVVEGELCIETEIRTIYVKEGESLIIPAGMSHRLRLTDTELHVRYVMNCKVAAKSDDDDAVETANALINPPLRPIRLPTFTKSLMSHILLEAEKNEFGSKRIIEAHLAAFLQMIAREVIDDPNRKNMKRDTEKRSLYDLRMESILLYLKGSAYKKVSVMELAKQMNMSISQLERTVRIVSGQTPQSLIQSFRIEKAKSLLKDHNLSIKDITDILEFASESEFSRCFKRIEGLPPGKYREALISSGKQSVKNKHD